MAIHLRTAAVKVWFSTLRIILLLLLILIATLAGLVGSEVGRVFVVNQGIQWVSFWSGQQLTVDGVQSSGIGEWEFANVSWQSADGMAVTLNELKVSLRWRYALQNRWWFNEIDIEQLHIKFASADAAADSTALNISDIWPSLPAIRLDLLTIDGLQVERANYDTLSTELSLQADVNWGVVPLRFVFSARDEQQGNHLSLNLSNEAVDQVRLSASFQAKPDSVWAQWINWNLPAAASASGDVLISYQDPQRLLVDIEQWAMPWQNNLLSLSGSAAYVYEQRQLQFLPLGLTLNDKEASLQGWLQAEASELFVLIDEWSLSPFVSVLGVTQLDAVLSVDAQWLGGWLAPRATGLVDLHGQYGQAPVALNLSTQATADGVLFEPSQAVFGESRFDIDGFIDWRRNALELNYNASIIGDAALSELMSLPLKAREFLAQASGQVSGELMDPRIEFDAFSSILLFDQMAQGRIQGAFQAQQLDLANLWLATPIVKTNGAGEFGLADGQWRYDAESLQIDDALLAVFGIELPVEFTGQVSGPVKISGQGAQFEASGDVALLGRWQNRPLSARVNINRLNNRSLRLGESHVRLAEGSARVSGDINWSQTRWNLKIDHQQLPLDLLHPWVPFWPDILESLTLALTGQTKLTGSWNEPVIETVSKAEGSWFNEPIQASVDMRPTSATQWLVRSLEANWFNTDFNYQGLLRPFELQVDGNAYIEKWDLEDLQRFNRQVLGLDTPLPETLTGDMWLDAQIKGGLEDYRISGHGFLAGFYKQRFVQLSSSVSSLTPESVSVDQLLARWSGNSVDFALNWAWPNDNYQIDVAAEITDSEPIKALLLALPLPVLATDVLREWQGQAQANLNFISQQGSRSLMGALVSQGSLFGEAYDIDWFGDGDINSQFAQRIDLNWGETQVAGKVDLVAEQWQGNLTVSTLPLDKIRVFSSSIPDSLSANINADISLGGPFANPNFSASLTSTGRFGERPWQAELQAMGSKEAWQVESLKLLVDQGGEVNLLGNGQGWQGQLDLQIQIPDTRYWINNNGIGPGSADISLNLSGDLRQPDIISSTQWQSSEWPLNLSAEIATVDQQYVVSVDLLSEAIERVSVAAAFPKLALADYLLDWQTTPYQAEIEVATPFSVLDPLFVDQPSIAIDGLILGTMTTSGTWLNPNWQGQIEWQQGRFDFIERGTLINNISLTIAGRSDRFEINGTATDDRNGAMDINGEWLLQPTPDNPLGHAFDLAVNASSAHLVRDALIDATVSAQLAVTGDYHNLLVSGVANVSPLNIQTETFLLDGAPQLNIVSAQASDIESEAVRPFYWPNGQWDIEMVANNRANLYGQGISAELSGNLEMVGTFPEPVFAGRFVILRGTYSGLGKLFRISSGSVQVQNNQLVFDLTAEYTDSSRLNGLAVTLNIYGTQDELRLDLSSQPQLDQNELLAQLVFGESIENISEFQALQLALLVNNLRTGNSGLDIIGATRDILTFDSLSVDTQTTDQGELGFSISAGKYLNDYLYLEVEQGVGLEQGFKSSLQLQLSPNTYLELFSEDALEQGGVEFIWGIDY